MKRIIIAVSVLAVFIIGVIGLNADKDRMLQKAEAAEALSPAVDSEIPEVPEQSAVDTEEDSEMQELLIKFSHKETFYDENISIEISCSDPDAKIYYTVNGARPDKSSRLFKENISLKASSTEKILTIKAIAVKGDEASQIFTKSYLVGSDIFSRFTPETYVFILSADPYDLYDFYYGIAVEGNLRDEYIKETKDYYPNPPAPANYNIRGLESERDFYVEAYDYLGNKLIEQAAAGRVAGGWSRATDQKSWRLIARGATYGEGKFRYPFFENAVNYDGQIITKFDRITLRNNGNDRTEAVLRDELSAELSRQAGFPDTQGYAPAAVFLNSQYYGFSWLKESYCSGYLEQMYGGKKENYQTVKNDEKGTFNGEIGGEVFAHNDWFYIYNLADNAASGGEDSSDSFKNDKIFDEFCSLVDIDNLIMYYAIQVFISNNDWPNNNLKVYKYYADEDEVIINPHNDGKWRFLMYDAEFGWGLYGHGYNANTLGDILKSSSGGRQGGVSVILQAVLQRDDMKEKFANTMCDLMSGAFSVDNAVSVLEKLSEASEPELLHAMKNYVIWYFDYIGKREQVWAFAMKRGEVVYENMSSVFKIAKENYSVSLTGAENAETWLNTRKVSGGEMIETEYFACYGTNIKAELYPGYEFYLWEINGEPYYENEMRIDASFADKDGKVNIKLHTMKKIDGQPLLINTVSTEKNAGWIELYNPNLVTITTKIYYLSDNSEDLTKWKMPVINVQPQESSIIVAKNNKSQDSLMKPQMNFSLKAGETLYLSDINGEIIAAVQIPEMGDNEVLVRQQNGMYSVERAG